MQKQWKVAAVEGGSYTDFTSIFRQMALSLSSDGLLSTDFALQSFIFDEKQNWDRLSEQSKNDCIYFVENGLYNAHWDPEKREEIKSSLTKRIVEKKDIDMLWAFGTIGGLDYADSSLGIPILVITPSSPELAGIIGEGEFSNKKNVHVQKERGRAEAEIMMFHDIFKFKNLGVIVDILPENQLAQHYPTVKQMAHELGVNLIECRGDINGSNEKNNYSEYEKCITELSKSAEAVFLPVGNGSDPENFLQQIEPLIKKRIPTFTQNGIDEVRRGALLSLAENDMQDSGAFEAGVVKKIMSGVAPEAISQYYNPPLTLALNLKTARLIEWKPPFEVLIAVDVIYQDIKAD